MGLPHTPILQATVDRAFRRDQTTGSIETVGRSTRTTGMHVHTRIADEVTSHDVQQH